MNGKNIDGNCTQLAKFVRGEDTNTFGLHFIGTPDTMPLVEEVRKLVQALLDLASINKNGKQSNENIVTIGNVEYGKFASGESEITIDESVRGKHVYLFSDPSGDSESESNSLNDKLMNDLLVLHAVKDHGAQTTNLVLSCMPYARQDKTSPDKRQPISIDMLGGIISNLTSDNGYCISMDLHNPASKSAFRGTNFINLYTGWIIKECIKDLGISNENLVLAPADVGGMKTVEAISKELELKNITVVKSRDYSSENKVTKMDIYGDIEGKDVLIQDDMLDTGGTIVTLINQMLELKPKSINLAITHGMFNKNAFSKLKEVRDNSNGIFQYIYITDSINKEGLPDYVKIVSSKYILSNTITSIFKGLSIHRGDSTDYTNI